MPIIDNRIIEALRRQQLVTEYIIYPFSDIKNYQINLTNVPSFSKEDVLIVFNRTILPHWVESKGSVWTKIPNLIKNTPLKIYTLTGNPSAASASNGTDTFVLYNTNSLTGWNNVGASIVDGKIQISAGTGKYFAYSTLLTRPTILEWTDSISDTTNRINGGFSSTNNTVFVYQTGNGVWIHRSITADLNTWLQDPTANILNVGTYNIATHNWKIVWGETIAATTFWRDGIQLTTPSSRFPADTSLYIKFGGSNAYTSPVMNLSDIRVRKYASPEPIIKKIRTLNKSLLLKELMR